MMRVSSLFVTMGLSTLLFTVQPPRADAVILINELLPNPGGLDANRDGIAHATQDEFVELVNTGLEPVSLAGWTLADAVKVRHVFAADAILPGCSFFVVFGGGTPEGFLYVATASTGSLALNNSGDTVTLKDADAALIDSFIYTTPLTAESFTRFPDGAGPFVPHLTVSELPISPGATVDGQLQLPRAKQDPIVPEPTTSWLWAVGLMGLISTRQLRRT